MSSPRLKKLNEIVELFNLQEYGDGMILHRRDVLQQIEDGRLPKRSIQNVSQPSINPGAYYASGAPLDENSFIPQPNDNLAQAIHYLTQLDEYSLSAAVKMLKGLLYFKNNSPHEIIGDNPDSE